MNFQALLNRAEIAPLALRILGVIISALFGLIAIKVFLALDHEAGPFLVAMITWLVFLPLLQFGFGRPVYSFLRKQFVKGQLDSIMLNHAVLLFGALSASASCIFGLFSYWLVHDHIGRLDAFGLFVISVGFAVCATGLFQRDYCYAIGREVIYEAAELLRRLAMLVAILLVGSGISTIPIGFGLIGFAVATHLMIAISILRSSLLKRSSISALVKSIWKDAFRFFVFSINEIILYNLPLIYYSIIGGSEELVFIGIWMRLFQVSVLPMRMLIDARVNRLTATFHLQKFEELRRQLKVNLMIALISVITVFIFLSLSIQTLLEWLGAAQLKSNIWLLIGLGCWSLGNTFQHVYGTFTVSHGDGFNFAIAASMISVLVGAMTFFGSVAFKLEVGPALALMGTSYALTALLYRQHILQLIRPDIETS